MAEAVVPLKRCTTCKNTKPVTEFCRDASRWDGLDPHCKPCRRAASRRYGRSEAGKAAQTRYAGTTLGKTRRRRYDTSLVGTARLRARQAVRSKINEGKLPYARTLKCAHCGQQAHSWHHHLGYEPQHRLAVIPLCRTCHQAADAKNSP